METAQVCFDVANDYAVIVTGVVTTIVTICSVLANFIRGGILGKIVGYGAVNIKTSK